MAKDKRSFLMYCDVFHTVKQLPDEKAGELFKHILAYVNDENPVSTDPLINIAFEPIKQQFKRDLKKWEGIRESRSKAGKASAIKRQQKQHMLTSVESVQQTSTNPTVNVNGNVNVIDDVYREKLNTFKTQLSGSGHDGWRESMYRKSKIPKNTLGRQTDKFIDHLIIIGKKHETLNDFKNHFYNWINRQENINLKKEAL